MFSTFTLLTFCEGRTWRGRQSQLSTVTEINDSRVSPSSRSGRKQSSLVYAAVRLPSPFPPPYLLPPPLSPLVASRVARRRLPPGWVGECFPLQTIGFGFAREFSCQSSSPPKNPRLEGGFFSVSSLMIVDFQQFASASTLFACSCRLFSGLQHHRGGSGSASCLEPHPLSVTFVVDCRWTCRVLAALTATFNAEIPFFVVFLAYMLDHLLTLSVVRPFTRG